MNSLQNQMQDFESRVRESFERQTAMRLIGASLKSVKSGAVEIVLPFRADLTQQHGFVHGGFITTIADTACGYAAFTLMPQETEVLSVEFKANFLRPAQGKEFIAAAQVLKSGKTLMVVKCDVFADVFDEAKMVATMLGTMICR
jgi:uncharacterized protein (TIGR00369 family)